MKHGKHKLLHQLDEAIALLSTLIYDQQARARFNNPLWHNCKQKHRLVPW